TLSRGGVKITSVARADIQQLHLYSGFRSDQPFRDLFYLTFMLLVLTSAVGTLEGVALAFGQLGVWALGAWFLIRTLRRATRLDVFGDSGTSLRFVVEPRLAPPELVELKRRLRDEMNFPVSDE